jgi:undecaprenyl-diphosphatase
MSGLAAQAFHRFAQAELRLCHVLNRCSHQIAVRSLFRTASRLGDGWVWYTLMGWLAVAHGREGLIVSVQMVAAGALGVLVYRLIKQRTVRERPFVSHDTIVCAIAPLDRYSFPSGHTLHSVSFTLIVSHYFPVYTECLVILTVLIALSRITLGLHYPTDVAAGALLGGFLATGMIHVGTLILP